ncbi:metal-dependent hydrolase [Phytoactinopolyspora alkaliphila]|uniref:Metal-dependent hydrolase n=1 Tax=Phytoactinopolyspora alkaliphila TaxID=1783498 RepID=A0A6N9YHS8_9ACTN|nr:metal-dependent hydrolase [Phytoactinopolyspora alkaliphila]
MSWAAHEFENYFIQKHIGTKASFLGVVIGAQLPDMFTKAFVYAADDAAAFHRGWPGVGFSHSLLFGVVFAVAILGITKSRAWALGVLIGHWAHVLTDVADTAGVMLFFPFSMEPLTISMWKHAAVEGRYGDAAAYYSSLGGVWDLFWLAVTLIFAWRTLTASYFRDVVIPADPRVWGWIHRTFRLPERALLLLYQGLMFYGIGRMVAWFLYARFDAKTPFQPSWGGPEYIAGNDISDSGWVEVLIRTGIGGVLFVAFMWAGWRLFGRRLWQRGYDVPAAVRGPGIHAILELPSSKRRTVGAEPV